MKRVLITGAGGFVAGSVIWQAGTACEVHAVSRGDALARRDGVRWHQFDPCNADRLAQCFHEVNPDAVIHTAAVADIDYCQTHQELARKVNVDLTRTVAELCATGGAKLVHCSTDTVFDGEHAPYREQDVPQPVNFYGQTKVEGERIVMQSGANCAIARLAFVVGLPILGAGNSFLARMLSALKAGREVAVPPDEIRTPIDVITLGRALFELATANHTGIVHLAGNEIVNRLEMARRIATRFGFSPKLIVASVSAGIPGRAPRPRNISLDNRKARAQLETPMLDLDEALSLILQTAPP
ncbi:MAG: SDR family oxidoreductase [Limisphaerales bacterium]